MSNRYIREDKERRMARLGIIGKAAEVEFIDRALDAALSKLEEKKEK